jgi:hypothetical protein
MGHLCEKEEKKRKKKKKRKKEWGEKCVMRLRNGSDISFFKKLKKQTKEKSIYKELEV